MLALAQRDRLSGDPCETAGGKPLGSPGRARPGSDRHAPVTPPPPKARQPGARSPPTPGRPRLEVQVHRLTNLVGDALGKQIATGTAQLAAGILWVALAGASAFGYHVWFFG